MSELKVQSFKDKKELDLVLDRILHEHPRDFKDKSDLLRKACHFFLETLGYEWRGRAEKPVDADSLASERKSAISEVLVVDTKS